MPHDSHSSLRRYTRRLIAHDVAGVVGSDRSGVTTLRLRLSPSLGFLSEAVPLGKAILHACHATFFMCFAEAPI